MANEVNLVVDEILSKYIDVPFNDDSYFVDLYVEDIYAPISLMIIMDIEEALDIIINDDESEVVTTVYTLKEICHRKLMYVFRELMEHANYKGGFSVISPDQDIGRNNFYTKLLQSQKILNKMLKYFGANNYTEDEIDLIDNGGKAKRYKFVREN